MSTAPIPEPLDSDPSDVSVALEAGGALWDNGETREALRWFSRAAEAAEAAGDDMRALTLARAVAELRDELQIHSILPPPPAAEPAPPAPAGVEPAPPEAPALGAPASPAPPTSPVAAAPQTSVTGGTPGAKRVNPFKPAHAEPAAPVVAPQTAEPLHAASPPRVAAAPSPAASAEASAAAGENAGEAGSRTLHVSVKPSVRDPNLLLVRILPKGATAPTGTHEAFLTAASAEIDLGRLDD